MLNIKENEFSALTEEQGTKVQTALQGSLPAGCVHYFLPLLVSKKVEINGEIKESIQAPVISVDPKGVETVEMRAIGGLNRTHAKAIFTTRRPKREDFVSQYNNFDATNTLLSCIHKCMFTGIEAGPIVKVVRPTFAETQDGLKPVFLRYGEDINSPDVLVDKIFKADENKFVNEVGMTTYKAAAKQLLSKEQITERYETIKAELIDKNVLSAEAAEAWAIKA